MPNLPTIEDLLHDGTVLKGNDPSLEIRRLPIGIPSIDALLGGGLPLGHCLQAFGPESTGKTLLTQIAVAAVQKSQYPLAVLMDLEHSYDEPWWRQSGVDTEKLLVSAPQTAEQAIDIMRGILNSSEEVGIIVLDSLAAMIPQPEMDPEKSSTDSRQPGLQAKVITYMYHQILPLLAGRTIFFATNQMRDSIGLAGELDGLPGGRAARHYSHIVLRTRRESWITDNNTKSRLGFYMEIINKKNKLASVPDGEAIKLPFMFSSQIDWTTSYIEDGIRLGFIVKAGPYYKTAGKSFLGMPNLRQFFSDYPEEFEILKTNLGVE